MMMHGHIDPGNDSVFDLGTTAHRWGAVHAVSGVFDNGRINQGLAEYQLASGSGVFQQTYVDVEWDTTIIEDTDYFSRSAGIITINQAGIYRVNYAINIDSLGTGRSIAEFRLWLNGSSSVPGGVTYVYSRTTADGEGSVAKSLLVSLSQGDTLVAQAQRRDGSTHDYSFLPDCNMNLEFIR